MTLVLIRKGLRLEGRSPKTKDSPRFQVDISLIVVLSKYHIFSHANSFLGTFSHHLNIKSIILGNLL